jgi:hypothetical protein
MPPLWKQTINITENKVCELIEAQHHIRVHSINLLDEGWDNLVYLINSNLIFRFPRREQGVIPIENEIALLPIITKYVSFSLSCPEEIAG